MEGKMLEQLIENQGGINWLGNLKPLYLFNYLKSFCNKGMAEIFPLDEDRGWFFFFDITKEDEKIGVSAAYYQKGKMPTIYPVCLKLESGMYWYSIYTLDDDMLLDSEYCSRMLELQGILLFQKSSVTP